ncbi:MAG: LysR family transcriptional regulator [Gallionella sp.]|nr:LysR family transcriptional regulator [Gallionella sp.]MDP1593879.1 LysR family transcriptional regulator [Gallionella sp.]MDP1870057.1 LysR family transcriptional regulator [Gallionella sp.]
MNLRWDDLKLFLAVHEQGSLSGAARLLKLGQPTLSRRIAELEEAVGEALFERQSQGASLTAAGQKLLPAAQSMAEWANEAELSVKKQTYLPEGKVRIAAPPGIAYEVVAPLAAKIRRKHPQIQIEALSGIETLNLGRGEADLSLRSGKPTDADLVCVDEISSTMRVYVSKAYAARLSSSPCIADLDWICWSASYDEMLTNQELSALIPNFKPAFTSDDFIVQMAACKAGVGAMILPQVLHHYAGLRELHKLQELDIDLGPSAVGSLYLVCHKRHRYLPKVQLVMDFISMEFDYLRQAA